MEPQRKIQLGSSPKTHGTWDIHTRRSASPAEASGPWHSLERAELIDAKDFRRYIQAHPLVPERVRRRALISLGVNLDNSSIVFPGLRVTGDAPIEIGSQTFVNEQCVFDAAAAITIGQRVSLGNRVMLLTSNHDYHDPRQRGGPRIMKPIFIEDGAWICAGVTILSGVRIGKGCVVAAGSVVISDCTPHGLYGGIPAARLRDLPTSDQVSSVVS